MYAEKTNDELLIILSQVCDELNNRAIGIADDGGKSLPVIEQQGNTVTCVHIGSNLGVSIIRENMKNIRTVMFENGQTLTAATSLSKFIKNKNDGSKETGQEGV